MNSRYKILKTRCEICGRTVKKVVPKHKEFNDYDFYRASDDSKICKQCEHEYHVIDNYQNRGYGYKYSSEPRMTTMDTGSTPTFGIELEVAGNIKNIDKIYKLTDPTRECSIGYDTSVEGAMFELSYAPGTYYWYMYESKLQAVCQLLQKDKWTIHSDTIGTHIHVGRINTIETRGFFRVEAERNPLFWLIMEIIGERRMNKYCAPYFRNNHHDAISFSRWRTLEFRFFSGTYDFNTIMQRMRFLRQLIDNASWQGINWKGIRKDIKDWIKEKVEKSKFGTDEQKESILQILDGTFEDFVELTNEQISAIEMLNRNIEYSEDYDEDDEYINEDEEEPAW